MSLHLLCAEELKPETKAFYQRAIARLIESEVPFLAGGGYAFEAHTGIRRQTKDFDIFVMPGDVDSVLETLASVGCRTEITYPHWLGKAYCGSDFMAELPPARRYVFERALQDLWIQGSDEAAAERREYTAMEYFRLLDGLRYKDIVKLSDPSGVRTRQRYADAVSARRGPRVPPELMPPQQGWQEPPPRIGFSGEQIRGVDEQMQQMQQRLSDKGHLY